MITLGKYPAENILPLIGHGKPHVLCQTERGIIKTKSWSDRLECFSRNHQCVICKKTGNFFLLQSHYVPDNSCKWCHFHQGISKKHISKPHLNLYFINEKGKHLLMTKDHIVPKSKGGADDMSNLVTMCSDCNNNKSNFSIEEFAANNYQKMQQKTLPMDLSTHWS